MTFASILLCSAMMSPMQQPDQLQNLRRQGYVSASGAADRASLNENIEVLRQILRRKIHRAGQTSWVSSATVPALTGIYNPQLGNYTTRIGTQLADGGSIYVPDSGGDFEGVHLPGYGVIFTTTLPASSRTVDAADDRPAPQPLSDWERAAMEFRGEKPPASPQANPNPPSIRDVILRVLAENGRHLTQLRDDERITVVVTFRDGGHSWRSSGTSLTPLNAAAQNAIAFPQAANPFMPAQSGLGTTLSQLSPSGAGKHPSSARDYELLGDLHMKQQQYKDALDVYNKAINAYEQEAKTNPQADHNPRLATFYARQAQALLAQGQEDAAMDLLKKAQSMRDGKKSADPKPKEPAKPRVPAKLIISATKRQLDQVGAGKMTVDEFRKAASVEEE
jgi:hypothetical protein